MVRPCLQVVQVAQLQTAAEQAQLLQVGTRRRQWVHLPCTYAVHCGCACASWNAKA